MDVAEENGDTATEAVVSPPSFRPCLVTLPPELLIEIVKFAMLSKSRRGVYFESRNNLREISRVCKLLSIFTISFLFKTVRQTINEDKIHAQLQAPKGNALILSSIRYLSLCTRGPEWPPKKWRDHYNPSIKICSRATAALLVKVLCKMTPEEVRITFQCGNKSMVAHFRAELVKQKACLQSVRSLTYPSSVTINFILKTFPNLRYLSLNIDGSPMHTAGLRVIAPKLQTLATLELSKAHWTCKDMEEVVELFPSINYLPIDGELKFTRVSSLIPIFRRFSHLEKLALTEVPWVYAPRGLVGEAFQKRIKELRASHRLRELPGVNVFQFFHQCKSLKELLLKEDMDSKVYQSVKQGRDVIKVKRKNRNKTGLGRIKMGWPVVTHAI